MRKPTVWFSREMRKPERCQTSTSDREAGSWKFWSVGDRIIPARIPARLWRVSISAVYSPFGEGVFRNNFSEMLSFLSTNSYLDISLAHWLVLLSTGLSLSGSFAYIRDMFRGKSKPNLVTWGLWAFAPLIATCAAVSASADIWATVRIFMSGFGPLLVFIAAFLVRQSYWKLSPFDYACGALSLIALGVWLGADSPLLAILLAALADLFATLPTIIKAWKYPETETVYTYFIGLFTASIVIPAIPVWNIENSAFQIYLLIANTALFLIVIRGYFLNRIGSVTKN